MTDTEAPPRPQEAAMQSDIVQRLNDCPDINHARIVPIGRRETEYVVPASVKFALIAEITRLTEALRAAEEREKAWREALEPFAKCCEDWISDDEDDEEWARFRLLIKDYRRARQALAGAKP